MNTLKPKIQISLGDSLLPIYFVLMFGVLSRTEALGNEPSLKLVNAIDKLVEKNGIHANEPGVAILIYQPGKPTFQKGYGLANLKSEQPITPRTMFELASVSKTMTSTAVLILHDRGKLSIQDEIRKHIPELPEFKKGQSVHIRDLLSHTSGLPEYFDLENVPKRNKTHHTNEDYVQLFSRRPSEFGPQFVVGTQYDYCNTNYLLLAVIIQRVTGKSFGTFLRDEIFGPAQMEHSFVYESPAAVPEQPTKDYIRAVGYEWRKKKQVWEAAWGVPPARHEELLVVGDGGVWTNLEDMARWDIALRAGRLLKPETWKMAITPSRTKDGTTLDYGLGWMVYFDDPKRIYGYGHDGSWGGFQTSYYQYLTADRTTVLLSNRGNFDADRLWKGLDELVELQSSRSRVED